MSFIPIFLNKNLIQKMEFNAEGRGEIVYFLLGKREGVEEYEEEIIIEGFVDEIIIEEDTSEEIRVYDLKVVDDVVYSDYTEIRLRREFVKELRGYYNEGYDGIIVVHTHPEGEPELTPEDMGTNREIYEEFRKICKDCILYFGVHAYRKRRESKKREKPKYSGNELRWLSLGCIHIVRFYDVNRNPVEVYLGGDEK
jgi:proteasome lid subunit RPN8/RPN11